MSQQHSLQHVSKPTSIFSWPPSPTILYTHLITRSILLLTDTVGLSLLLAIGTSEAQVCAIVGGSFLTASLSLTPWFMLWNRKLLRRVRKSHGQYKQIDNGEDHVPKYGLKALNFVTILEGFGALAFFTVYTPLMIELSHYGNNWYRTSVSVTYSYGSVSILISTLLHSFLFTTQVAQLVSARRVRRSQKMVCPHCNHTMTRMCSSEYTTPPESVMAEHNGDMLGESLVDARISMSPGQETGTTVKTPRQSEHQSRAVGMASQTSVANEVGEGEGDALITKAG